MAVVEAVEVSQVKLRSLVWTNKKIFPIAQRIGSSSVTAVFVLYF